MENELEASDNAKNCLLRYLSQATPHIMEHLDRVGELMVGATPGSAGGDPPARYVRAGDILEGGALAALGNAAEPTRGRQAKLSSGDVLIRGRGIPHAATVPLAAEGAYPTNDVLLFRPDPSKVDADYVAAFLNLPRTREALSAGSQGAALSRLSVQALGSVEIPLPPLETQRKIAALAGCMEVEQRLLNRLRELRRQLNQQILQRLLGNAHDEGGNPRRGSHQADRPNGQSASPHLEVRNT